MGKDDESTANNSLIPSSRPGLYRLSDSLVLRGIRDLAIDELSTQYLRVIEILALAIQARDKTTLTQFRRTQVFAQEIGKELGLGSNQLEALKVAVLLHDIGRLAVPEHIVSKPGRLNPEEFQKMKTHPIIGAEVLELMRLPYPAAPIVRSCHEKWDGSGYPDGIKEEEIPIEARILCAVDFFVALTSGRGYLPMEPSDQAVSRLEEESGRSFDPQVVGVLQRRHAELERLVNTGSEKNFVLSTNAKDNAISKAAGTPAGFVKSSGEQRSDYEFIAPIVAARQEERVLFDLYENLGLAKQFRCFLLICGGLFPTMPSRFTYDAATNSFPNT